MHVSLRIFEIIFKEPNKAKIKKNFVETNKWPKTFHKKLNFLPTSKKFVLKNKLSKRVKNFAPYP
jgi:hypothetical protein